jgi:hypothetical protein
MPCHHHTVKVKIVVSGYCLEMGNRRHKIQICARIGPAGVTDAAVFGRPRGSTRVGKSLGHMANVVEREPVAPESPMDDNHHRVWGRPGRQPEVSEVLWVGAVL